MRLCPCDFEARRFSCVGKTEVAKSLPFSGGYNSSETSSQSYSVKRHQFRLFTEKRGSLSAAQVLTRSWHALSPQLTDDKLIAKRLKSLIRCLSPAAYLLRRIRHKLLIYWDDCFFSFVPSSVIGLGYKQCAEWPWPQQQTTRTSRSSSVSVLSVVTAQFFAYVVASSRTINTPLSHTTAAK